MNQDDEQSYQPSGENYGEYDEQSYVYHETGDVDESTIFTDVKSKRKDNYLMTDPGIRLSALRRIGSNIMQAVSLPEHRFAMQ